MTPQPSSRPSPDRAAEKDRPLTSGDGSKARGEDFPEVLDTEDETSVLIVGHEVSELAARLALAVHARGEWSCTDEDAFVSGLDATIERIWLRYEDELDEESQRQCGAADPGAQPFTLLVMAL